MSDIDNLIDDARDLASLCGQPETSSTLHRLCDALEKCETERSQLESLRILSLTPFEDVERGFSLRLKEDPTGIARLLADHFMDVLDDPRKWGAVGEGADKPAPNYVEMSLRSPKRGSVVVTIRRVAGKTPRQLQADAENARDVAEYQRDVKEGQLSEIADALSAIDNPNEHEAALRRILAIVMRK
jgi:hypothetical protein